MPFTTADVGLRKWEMINRRDPGALDEIFLPDTVSHQPDRDLDGIEEAKAYLTMFLTAFPDLTMEVHDVLAEGDRAVTRWSMHGTHGGETDELGPPTGRKVVLEGLSLHRTAGDRIVEEWERYDNLSILTQLGLVPDE
jgi:predicted ester cyclase